ncbi:MAG: PIN domain-containing protein [Candidatus Aminicenantes bacterium]|nr:PIN domain-containing protein [Candidatus Aminicenantes bacterium]NIM79620.1 PIN domain-containing protein [Candidatus Aminicenantes bacterium]NIN18945.1 PIN domain-containing protein [Candidatus Aminicenantes bacterium]NIN42848.1 PIN domain-containing protein [Candidatus Aminicenantes bacterium]NIN85582.1 PIN domain-containing protein [Candidatus Aminicenantes bacterium]
MAYKVFFDTNIILDILLKREPFFERSQKALLEVAKRKFIPYVSGSSITDLYYICKKAGLEKEKVVEYLKDLLNTFEVLIIDKETINNAFSLDMSDFEDAVQVSACKNEGIDLIVTRNKQDFEDISISIQTPEEFLDGFLETEKEEEHSTG